MPGSASISDPSSDPPPSGLTAMAKNVRDDKVMQVEAGGRLEACARKGESSSYYFLPGRQPISRHNIWAEQVEEVLGEGSK